MDKLIFIFSTAKNATLLCPFPVKFKGIPDLMDVSSIIKILQRPLWSFQLFIFFKF